MKERTQKTLSQVNGCPQRDRSETEWYGGVQTFMWICEDNIVEVPFDKEHLFEQILSPSFSTIPIVPPVYINKIPA